MCASDRLRKAQLAGFSLVELLVSLVFISILMIGMLRVFSSSLSSFVSITESTNIQRSSRWGLQRMQDDLFQLGYLMPPRVVTDLIGNPDHDALAIGTAPAQLTYLDSNKNPITVPTFPDILDMVMDVPLEARGTLASSPGVGGNQVVVTVPFGASDIKTGDIAFITDSAWEVFKISDPKVGVDGVTVTLTIANVLTVLDAYGNDQGNVISPTVGKTHFKTAPVEFIRPLQVVRYSLQPMNLDPANDDAQVPCLVRQVKALADPAFTTTVPKPEIIVEGVTGFALDLSLTGGNTWIRKDAKHTAFDSGSSGTPFTWIGQIKDDTQKVFTSLGGSNPFIKTLSDYTTGLSSTVDPFWFNYVPVLIKIDLETRTRIRRTEYIDPLKGGLDDPANPTFKDDEDGYRTRRHTLLVSPRNFSLGKPNRT